MRTLLIDIGNTNLKWSWLEDGVRSPLERTGYRVEGVTAQAYRCWSHAERPDRVLLANVAGRQVESELQQWMSSEWGLEIEVLTARPRQLGVKNGYACPEQLGVDRWMALIAAHADRGRRGATCIVDCGSAITLDLLAEDGCHQGGMILPGLAMMRRMMQEQTQIPPVEPSEHTALLAGDTAGAIAAGSLHAAAALVERVGQWATPSPAILLTGGDAPRLRAVMKREAEIDPELVMRGLARVAQSG